MDLATSAQKQMLADARKAGFDRFIADPAAIEMFFYLRAMPAKKYSIDNTFVILGQMFNADGKMFFKIKPRSMQIHTREDWFASYGAIVPEEIKPMLVWGYADDGSYGVEKIYTERDIVVPPGVSYSPNTLEVKAISFEIVFAAVLHALRYGTKEWTDDSGAKHVEVPGFFSNIIVEKSASGLNIQADDQKNKLVIGVPAGPDEETAKNNAVALLFSLIQLYIRHILPEEQFTKNKQNDLFNEIVELAAFYSVISLGCEFNRHIESENAFVDKRDKVAARLITVERLKKAVDDMLTYYSLLISGKLGEKTERIPEEKKDTEEDGTEDDNNTEPGEDEDYDENVFN